MEIEQQLRALSDRVDRLSVSFDQRVAALEQRVIAAESIAAPPVTPPIVSPLPPQHPRAVPQPAVATMPPPPTGARLDFSSAAEKVTRPKREMDVETILRWVGVSLVTLAGIFLVSTAVSRGWIGPELQLIAAALAGLGLLGGSVALADRRRPWSVAMGIGGTVVTIASAVASHEWKAMLSPGVATGLTAVAVAVAVGVAMRNRLDSVATTAFVAGTWFPLQLLSDQGDLFTLGWVMVSLLASTALGLTQKWPGVRVLNGWLSAFLLTMLAISVAGDSDMAVYGYVATAIAAAALWLGPIAAERLGQVESSDWAGMKWTGLDVRTVGLVPALVATVVSILVANGSDDPQTTTGLIFLAVSVLFILLSAATWGRTSKVITMSSALGASGVLAMGTAILSDGPVLMVAFAGQAAAAYLIGRELRDRPMKLLGYALGLAATVLCSVHIMIAIFEDFESTGHWFATLGITLAWAAIATLLYFKPGDEMKFSFALGSAWLLTMTWVTAALSDVPEGIGLISAVWAVMAIAGIIAGLTQANDELRFAGLATLGITLVKLLTIDLAGVDVLVRVALFFVIGVGLIVLGLKVPALVSSGKNRKSPEGPSEGSLVASGLDSGEVVNQSASNFER